MRIIAGKYGGRRIATPKRHELRPTSERVREAVFSMLAAEGALEGARVLDLFAGTGALGLEALSRGASAAYFVEKNRDAADAIRQSLHALECAACATVHQTEAEKFVRSFSGVEPFAVVFADPPYEFAAGGELLAAMLQVGLVGEDSRVVFETAASMVLPERVQEAAGFTLQLAKDKTYGDTKIWVYRSA